MNAYVLIIYVRVRTTNIRTREFEQLNHNVNSEAISRSRGPRLAENVVIGIIGDESAGPDVSLTVQIHTMSQVLEFGHCAPRVVLSLHVMLVDVKPPESADIHSQCGTVLDGSRSFAGTRKL